MEESWDSLWDPELLLSGWMASSFMLMTVSLLFYHMTRVSSLEMGAKLAGLFAVSLIFIALTICVSAVAVYSKRVNNVLNKKYRKSTTSEYQNNIKQERDYRILYITIGSLLAIIEIGICIAILMGTLIKMRKI